MCVLQAIYVLDTTNCMLWRAVVRWKYLQRQQYTYTTDGGRRSTQPCSQPSFCQLFTFISTDRKETLNHIHVTQVPNKEYEVQVAFYNIDSHDDKPTFNEPDVWQVIVPSSSAMNAITTAMHIIQISRAETMTNFMQPVDGKMTFTIDEIESIRQAAEDADVFKAWLDIEPTSIQVCLVDDVEKLRSMTLGVLSQKMEDVGKEAEEYLKEQE